MISEKFGISENLEKSGISIKNQKLIFCKKNEDSDSSTEEVLQHEPQGIPPQMNPLRLQALAAQLSNFNSHPPR